MRLWSTGFELNSLTALVEFTTILGAPTISTTNVHGGTYALRISSLVSGTKQGVTHQFTASANTGPYFLRAYIFIVAAPSAGNTILSFQPNTGSTANAINMKLNSTRTLQFLNNTTQVGSLSAALALNTWHFIEIKMDGTNGAGAGVLEAKLNGSVFATDSTQTISTQNTIAVGANLHSEAQTTGDIYFDDIALNDNTLAFQNTYAGPGQIIHLHPSAQGDNNDWSIQVGGTAGAANNFSRVGEVTPDDATTYNADIIQPDTDDFRLNATPNSIAATDIINVAAVGVRFSGASAVSDSTFIIRIKASSQGVVTDNSPGRTPTTTAWNTNTTTVPHNYTLTTYEDPTGAPWEKQTLDTAQIGYQINQTVINAVQISTLWLLVESTTRTIVMKGQSFGKGWNWAV